MADAPAAIDVAALSHSYQQREALRDLNVQINQGEIFGFLGPNGGGKSTLFRVLSTLMPPQTGQVRVFGHDVATQSAVVRGLIGVVFQAPSLDKKLTVAENLGYQAALYGLGRAEARARRDELLDQLAIGDRAGDRVETLSGGLRRRVELAKGMIHRPRLLLLDEPSTGLDPAARHDLRNYLGQLREAYGITVVLTTHLLDEAEMADRLGVLDQGRLIALDTPQALKAATGGAVLTVETAAPGKLAAALRDRWEVEVLEMAGAVRLEPPNPAEWTRRILEHHGELVESITIGRPSLEDAFIRLTGHRFAAD